MRSGNGGSVAVTLTKSVVFALVTVLAMAALATTISNGTTSSGRTFTALFTDATSLNKGDDVRMAGVKIGTVQSIGLRHNDTAEVVFTAAESAPMVEGTRAELRFRNLIGQRYIALEPGSSGGDPLRAGYTFSLDETRPALDLTMLFNGFQPLFKFLDPEDVNNLSAQIIAVFQGEGATVESLLSSTASLTSTLADRDQVIGDLITNLNSVLEVVSERTGMLDTTLVTLQRLVSGLAADRKTLGSTIEGMGELSQSVTGLLEEGRKPLRDSIDSLGDLSGNLAENEEVLTKFMTTMPQKTDEIGRMATYGGWLNFYICSIDGRIPKPEGYYGDLGVDSPAGRCQ
ncbi:MlaD family protein [Nocardioides sp. NPDC006273]|uniref:MlaD family protein n=1 Tax=Nocardioides sp. NPDC006273 TaxID=3155598 RepID=UPI0033BBAF66